jgi:hypothetical protein
MMSEQKPRGRPRGPMNLDRRKIALSRAISAGIKLLREVDPGVRLGAVHAVIQGTLALEKLDRLKIISYRDPTTRPTETFTKLPPDILQLLEAAEKV